MSRILVVPLLTEHGPARVFIDVQTAVALIPYLEEFAEVEGKMIDLILCVRCSTYAVADHKDCEGLQ
jgi:hypothetical protein